MLAGRMMEKGVFNDSMKPLVIEFGAGKAYLSSMISDCTDATQYILVDNQTFKLKVSTLAMHWKSVLHRLSER